MVTIVNDLAQQGYRLVAAANEITFNEMEIVGFFDRE